jgi:hypothetical protein
MIGEPKDITAESAKNAEFLRLTTESTKPTEFYSPINQCADDANGLGSARKMQSF